MCIALALVLGCGLALGEEAEKPRPLVLITNVKNPINDISKRELGRIYVKKMHYWENGERCVPIDQAGTSQTRKDFYLLVLNKDLYEMKRYWMQETMTGNGTPPVTLDKSATVKRYVRKIKGSVGYIYADEVDDTVKVLHVINLPEFNSLEDEVVDDKAETETETPSLDDASAP